MHYSVKKDGVILSVKNVSKKFFLCGILFSDSIFIKVLVNVSKKKLKITVGHQVYGKLYLVENKAFFDVESLDFFLVGNILHSQKHLVLVLKLIKVGLETIPQNLLIEGLYESFIEHTKLIYHQSEDASISFRNWILNSLK